MIKVSAAASIVAFMSLAVDLTGQSFGAGSGQKRPTISQTASVLVSVRDRDGASLGDVRLLVSGGAAPIELATAGAGTAVIPNLKTGTYRLRCEREGFVTLEREFTVRSGARTSLELVLDPVPPPPPPPPPEPPPATTIAPGGAPVTMSIVDFLDRNFIGREPLKESILACEPLETVRLLQIREGVARHTHDDLDEILYVVAGEGTVRIDEDARPLRPGSLAVVPHGTAHALDHTGKNPLVLVSALVGSPCEPTKAVTNQGARREKE